MYNKDNSVNCSFCSVCRFEIKDIAFANIA